MNNCPECGKELANGVEHCPNCSTPVSVPEAGDAEWLCVQDEQKKDNSDRDDLLFIALSLCTACVWLVCIVRCGTPDTGSMARDIDHGIVSACIFYPLAAVLSFAFVVSLLRRMGK